MNPHKLTMFGVQRAHLNWTEIYVCSRKYAQSEKCLTAAQGVAGLIPGTRQNWRDSDDHVKWWTPLQLKPGFHMIVRIVLIVPVVSKYFKTIRTTGAIGSFHMIILIASEARDEGSSAMSLGQTIEFLHMFCKQAT